ncbi:GGDEF domain-containing protein [Allostreptomyces psammosilenae]|uniref:Diguanylate cyclase (GGDEF)-like protein/PAS domain S-box-containing protein n=1 Tax=Allostreptomyces psammosilenae TaxID=1892865 RepID=A0A853AAG9_9ACTN|nr:GGDEF domain-containing protein [Allostreptomyces psammosilenae]NYI07621.1 diguanylate cyclase (GGDEF)-like protein/PAS domain S-box-containing protein [Allostreptomyces psammosilenae]
MEADSETFVRLETMRRLHRVVAELNAARSLPDTLHAVADGVVASLSFGVAVVNLVRADGDLTVCAVSGDEQARRALLGRVGRRDQWERLLTRGQEWGTLRFVPHDEAVLSAGALPGWADAAGCPTGPVEPAVGLPRPVAPAGRAAAPAEPVGPVDPGGAAGRWAEPGAATEWIPGPEPGEEAVGAPAGWCPGDVLLAPMHTSGGELQGVLSVDLPAGAERPALWQREGLEMFAAQASIAISNARLRADMQRAMTRLEREQQALRASEESFRAAFEYAPSGMAMAELHSRHEGKLLRVNAALCRMLGLTPTGLREISLHHLVHPDDMAVLEADTVVGREMEVRLACRDGDWRWVCLRTSVVKDATDTPRYLLTHVEDIEERKRHELMLAHRASHDALTGLPNSAELRARLARRLCSLDYGMAVQAGYARERRDDGAGGAEEGEPGQHQHVCEPGPADRRGADGEPSRGLAVLFCDLDGFKSINDRFGHHTGDAVLVEVARRLTGAVREGDTVARLGGDEFVVLADGIGREEVRDLAARLRTVLAHPIRVDGRAVRVGASFGVGWAGCGMTADDVLRAADQRMYSDKRTRSRSQRRAV